MIRFDTPCGRLVVAATCVPALLCMTIVVLFAFAASHAEFRFAITKWNSSVAPMLAVAYREWHSWGWAGPFIGTAWLAVLLFRKNRTVGVTICYLAFVAVFTTAWLIFTFLAFYLGNQIFHA